MTLQTGDIIGAYRIEEAIGQGGMATVYRAHHERLARDVAIKIMHPTFLSDDSFLARFSREARIVAQLDHANIVPIYDYNDYNGMPYLVMRYIAGPTLKRKALKDGMTLQETADVLGQVANGLDYAHAQGVLHRDMKPSNIIIDHNSRAYITDFGLARIAQAGESTISHDMMLGTPFYISPEQAQGERTLTHHTDIYSLGVILYELVSGQVPFAGDTPYAIVHGHIYTPPPSPLLHNPTLPEGVEDVLMKALAKEPKNRFESAGAMLQAFREAIAEANTSEPISSIAAAVSRPHPAPEQPAEAEQPSPAASVAQADEQPKQKPRTRDGRNMEVESSFDLGNLDISQVDWSQLGNRINTGIRSFAEMIEERIDSELYERSGTTIDEERIRKQVKKRIKARQEFVGHLGAYLGVMSMLFVIWFVTSRGFPWPLFPAMGWGIGIVAHGADYYSKYGAGARRREDEIEREVAREMGRDTGVERKQASKAKKDHRTRLVDDPPQVRLNADGELTDSFIEETDRRR